MVNNSNKGNKWLIISYLANIDNSVPANWIDDRLIHLKRNGVIPLLLSSFCGGRHQGLFHKRVLSLDPAGFKHDLRFILKRRGLKGFLMGLIETLILLPIYPFYLLETKVFKLWGEGQFGWVPSSAIAGLIICLIKKPCVIYSTGGPLSPHISAAFISKLTKIPWIAELEDPLVCRDVGRNEFSKKGLAYCEKMLFDKAEKVIFCTEKAKESAEIRHGRGKGVVIYPGVPVEKLPSKDWESGEKLRFIHTGSLYQTRNLDYFLGGLKIAIAERPELKNHVTVELYGAIHTNAIKERMDKFPYKVINYHGMIGRLDASNNALNSDILLLIQNTDYRSCETIPSKIYEYLFYKRPILGLIYKNEELETMLESHGHVAVSADNEIEIAEKIVEFFNRWSEGELNVKNRFVDCEYTVQSATEQLVNLVNSFI